MSIFEVSSGDDGLNKMGLRNNAAQAELKKGTSVSPWRREMASRAGAGGMGGGALPMGGQQHMDGPMGGQHHAGGPMGGHHQAGGPMGGQMGGPHQAGGPMGGPMGGQHQAGGPMGGQGGPMGGQGGPMGVHHQAGGPMGWQQLREGPMGAQQLALREQQMSLLQSHPAMSMMGGRGVHSSTFQLNLNCFGQ